MALTNCSVFYLTRDRKGDWTCTSGKLSSASSEASKVSREIFALPALHIYIWHCCVKYCKYEGMSGFVALNNHLLNICIISKIMQVGLKGKSTFMKKHSKCIVATQAMFYLNVIRCFLSILIWSTAIASEIQSNVATWRCSIHSWSTEHNREVRDAWPYREIWGILCNIEVWGTQHNRKVRSTEPNREVWGTERNIEVWGTEHNREVWDTEHKRMLLG